jgi:hypothetical protein
MHDDVPQGNSEAALVEGGRVSLEKLLRGHSKAQECPRLRSLTSKARALAALDGARAKCAP